MVKMFCHVFVGGLVAAKRNAAGLAGTQVDPVAADLDTFLADKFFGRFQLFDRLHV
jgi:hypothetical protein